MFLFLLACAGLTSVLSIPIDNGVEGEPEIECGPDAITVSFNTRNTFEGKVAVFNQYLTPGCRVDSTGGRVASIRLPFNTCNMQRTRSLNPRGIFVRTTVGVYFHPVFVTKVDRVYAIQCFYMEADKTVSQQLEVSQLTTGFQSAVVPMPICRYDILDTSATGQPVKFAIVGQAVYHKWTCDSETVDTFCMRVYSCFVDDGNGEQYTLLDQQGCAQDRFILRQPEYITDLMAGQEAHVFKYADRPQLFFQCQIAITIKEPGTPCARPTCPTEPGLRTSGAAGGGAAGGAGNVTARPTGRRFFKRDLTHVEEAGVIDVTAQLESLGVSSSAFESSPETLQDDSVLRFKPRTSKNGDANICLSSVSFGILTGFSVLLVVLSSALLSVLCLRSGKRTMA